MSWVYLMAALNQQCLNNADSYDVNNMLDGTYYSCPYSIINYDFLTALMNFLLRIETIDFSFNLKAPNAFQLILVPQQGREGGALRLLSVADQAASPVF